MKILKVKFILFSLLLLATLIVVVTSCEQASILPTSPVEVVALDEPNNIDITSIDEKVDYINRHEDLETEEEYAFSIGFSPVLYFIGKDNIEAGEMIKLVEENGFDNEKPLKVLFTNDGEINSISKPNAVELKKWEDEVKPMYNGLSIEEGNIEERYSTSFSSWNEMNDAFNFLKSMGCNDHNEPPVTPCNTFRYKRDGCYARAHKMTRTLEEHYGKSTKKVFVYGRLSGGCVTWRFHVAPLVYVHGTQYVLDPSLFNSPVTLDQWISSMMYNPYHGYDYHACRVEIKNGSTYAPYPGFSCSLVWYWDDPDLEGTDWKLREYKDKKGCEAL